LQRREGGREGGRERRLTFESTGEDGLDLTARETRLLLDDAEGVGVGDTHVSAVLRRSIHVTQTTVDLEGGREGGREGGKEGRWEGGKEGGLGCHRRGRIAAVQCKEGVREGMKEDVPGRRSRRR